MEPSIAPGQRRGIQSLDRESLDAIGWDAGTGQADLITLQNQAIAALAAQIGVTVDWLEANPVLAAQRLSQDRTQDVLAMTDQSQIYEWGWSRSGRRSGYWRGEIELPAGTLATDWNPATDLDPLTAGGLLETGSSSEPSSSVQGSNPTLLTPDLLTPNLSAPTLGSAMPTIAPIDALAPSYLIGSEWLQSAF